MTRLTKSLRFWSRLSESRAPSAGVGFSLRSASGLLLTYPACRLDAAGCTGGRCGCIVSPHVGRARRPAWNRSFPVACLLSTVATPIATANASYKKGKKVKKMEEGFSFSSLHILSDWSACVDRRIRYSSFHLRPPRVEHRSYRHRISLRTNHIEHIPVPCSRCMKLKETVHIIRWWKANNINLAL